MRDLGGERCERDEPRAPHPDREAREQHVREALRAGERSKRIDAARRLFCGIELCGEQQARGIQLGLEYDPEPPFDSGTPERATAALTTSALPTMMTMSSLKPLKA